MIKNRFQMYSLTRITFENLPWLVEWLEAEIIYNEDDDEESREWDIAHSITTFYRKFKFKALELEIVIEHFGNVSYCYIGDIVIQFKYFEISGAWPHRFATDLKLSLNDKDSTVIIPLERYNESK